MRSLSLCREVERSPNFRPRVQSVNPDILVASKRCVRGQSPYEPVARIQTQAIADHTETTAESLYLTKNDPARHSIQNP